MEMLELVETIRAEEADIHRLFDGDKPIRNAAKSPSYMAGLVEAVKLIHDVKDGRRPLYYLKEAMTTSDFPLFFADVLDRQLLAEYKAWPATWPAYCNRSTVPDFRAVKRYPQTYGVGAYLPAVNQQEEYAAESLVDRTAYTYSVAKYGRRVQMAFETMVNDDLGFFDRLPKDLARSAYISEERFVTDLFCGADGPDATFYAAGNTNVVTANPALSISGLQTAYTVLSAQKDGDGNPIYINAVVLVVPPALKVVAENILNATQLEVTAEAAGGAYSGGAEQRLITANWMRNNVRVIVNPWIPIIASNSNTNTSWFLFADAQSGPPALELGFLRGYEAPQIFVKEPNQRRVGGAINVADGDFETDTIQHKVRHIFGGCTLDPKMSVASNGSGA